jgi:hypothetical protein
MAVGYITCGKKKTMRTKTANMPHVPDCQDPSLKVIQKFKRVLRM